MSSIEEHLNTVDIYFYLACVEVVEDEFHGWTTDFTEGDSVGSSLHKVPAQHGMEVGGGGS